MNITKLKKVIRKENPAMSINRPIRLHDIRLTLIKNKKNDWGDCFREISSMWNESNDLNE